MADAPAALERQLNELENLYEIARYLLAPRDEHAIAVHTVRSVMGTFGATSAALLLSATRRRLALEYASGIETSAEHATLMLEPEAVDWLIEAKAFRQDLYFRLNVVHIELPPLRERKDDIPLLVDHFARIFGQQFGREIEGFTDEALALLKSNEWPGNVRELENLMLREFLLADGDTIAPPADGRADRIEPADDAPGFDQAFRLAKARAVAQFERAYLSHVLTKTSGNISLAARLSQKDRSALNKLVKKHGLLSDQFRSVPGGPR